MCQQFRTLIVRVDPIGGVFVEQSGQERTEIAEDEVDGQLDGRVEWELERQM